MLIRNLYDAPLTEHPAHDGLGLVRGATIFASTEFSTGLSFINYTELPPGTSIGYHRHGMDEEVYVIIEGDGVMTVNGEERSVKRGDVIVNKPGWAHGLRNDGGGVLKVMVFEVGADER